MSAIVALIPARGGSKGIPRKNLTPLAGRPLITYTIDAARTSGRITHVVVSTDDGEIAEVAAQAGAEVVLRPAALAADDTPMAGVIAHAVQSLADRGVRPEILVLLQPTSPLRTAAHIDAALERREATGAEVVVSVTDVPHQFRPGSQMGEDASGRLVPLDPATPLLRQHKRATWARNGPAILAGPTAVLASGRYYDGVVVGYAMDRWTSIDIDGPDDLQLAAWRFACAAKSGTGEHG